MSSSCELPRDASFWAFKGVFDPFPLRQNHYQGTQFTKNLSSQKYGFLWFSHYDYGNFSR